MTDKTHSRKKERQTDKEKDLSRLLKYALDIETKALSEDQAEVLIGLVLTTHTGVKSDFPVWAIIVSGSCLVALVLLGGFLTKIQPVSQFLAGVILFANLCLSPLAALVIVQRRRWSYER